MGTVAWDAAGSRRPQVVERNRWGVVVVRSTQGSTDAKCHPARHPSSRTWRQGLGPVCGGMAGAPGAPARLRKPVALPFLPTVRLWCWPPGPICCSTVAWAATREPQMFGDPPSVTGQMGIHGAVFPLMPRSLPSDGGGQEGLAGGTDSCTPT